MLGTRPNSQEKWRWKLIQERTRDCIRERRFIGWTKPKKNCRKCKGLDNARKMCACQRKMEDAYQSSGIAARQRRHRLEKKVVPSVLKHMKDTISSSNPRGDHVIVFGRLNKDPALRNWKAVRKSGKSLTQKIKWNSKSFSRFLANAAKTYPKLKNFCKKPKKK